MIAAFMLRAVVVTALLALAAWLAERGLRLWRLPTRAVWSVAMLAALLLPALTLRAPSERATWRAPIRIGAVERGLAPVERAWHRLGSISAASVVGQAIALGWLLASLGVAGGIARAARRVGARRAGWRETVVDGERVLLSTSTGPAVIGLRRPRIVVPEWVLDLDEPQRRLIVSHEREHARARDPWLLAAGLLVLALEPWNPALWLLVARLRLAVEVDCDRRVLRARPDVHRYARLLIAVCQRARSPLPVLTPTLAESASPLARRIAVMTAAAPRHRRLHATLVASASLVLLAVACNLPGPADASDSSRAVASRRSAAPSAPDSRKLTEFKVDQPVMAAGSPAPRYPAAERAARIEGDVIAQFVVDTNGLALPGSLKVLKATAKPFADAVREALPSMRFIPAQVKGRKVRQLVQQPFTFQLAK